MKCIVCGSEIREGVPYCDVCGAQVVPGQNDQVGGNASQINYYSDDSQVQSYYSEASSGGQYETYPMDQQTEQPVFSRPYVERGQAVPEYQASGLDQYEAGSKDSSEYGIGVKKKKTGNGLIIILSSIIGVLTIGIIVVLILLLGSDKDPKGDTTANADKTESISTTQKTEAETTEAKTERQSEVVTEKKTEPKTDEKQTEEIIEAKPLPTQEEAKVAFDQLYKEAMQLCSDKNMNGFFELYTSGTSDSKKNDEYSSFERLLEKDYPDVQSEIIWDDGTFFIGFVLRSLTTVSGSNTNSSWSSKWMIIKYEGDTWKIDWSDEAYNAIYDENRGVEQKIYDSGYIDAWNNKRNAVVFDSNDLSWVNEKMIVPGTLDARIYYVWQEEDGSVCVFINIKNGTDVIQRISSIEITMEDDELGTVFKTDVGSARLDPKKAKNYIVRLELDEIKTGTKKWGSLHSNTHIVY